MAKDPAFLFYFRDFLVSTELMSVEDVGYYIRILCHMADKGRLSLEHMQSICKAYGTAHPLHSKFQQDEKGLFFNVRLEDEVQKRSNYTQSRRDNAKHMHQHMGNANANGNKDVIKQDDGSIRGKKGELRGTKAAIKKLVTFVRDNPPTVAMIADYCIERKNGIDAQSFHDKNTTIGWIDKNKIPYRDWKAVVRTWENYRKATAPPHEAPKLPPKRPVAIVVIEKIAAGLSDHDILHQLVGTYSEHAINEALMQARGAVK